MKNTSIKTVSGLPAISEVYSFKGVEQTRYYVNTAKIDKLDINVMYLTTYNNEGDSTKANWVTKIGLKGLNLNTKAQEMYANYQTNTKGMALVLKYGTDNAEKFGLDQYDIVKWHKETEQKMKEIIKANASKDSRGRPRKPVFYTAGLRYSNGTKGYAPNAAALVICSDDNKTILKEVIFIGEFMFEHTPVQEFGRCSKLDNKKHFKLTNGYSFTVYNANVVEDESDDWDDMWSDEDEDDVEETVEVVKTVQTVEIKKTVKTTDVSNAELDALLTDMNVRVEKPVINTNAIDPELMDLLEGII